MNPGIEQRKLAAIMFTDMVGYSALAQRNEKLALGLVPEGRKTIAQRFIAGLGRPGRVKPHRGDRTSSGAGRDSFLSPLRGFGARAILPSGKSLGYSLSPSGWM